MTILAFIRLTVATEPPALTGLGVILLQRPDRQEQIGTLLGRLSAETDRFLTYHSETLCVGDPAHFICY